MSDEQKIAKALDIIERFGGIDGSHHKMWVIDQVVRALTGCPDVVEHGLSVLGDHYTFTRLGESAEYLTWVREAKNGDDGPDTYEWDEGIAP